MPELTSLVGYMLRRAQMAVFKDFLACFEDEAITPAQYAVLSMIAQKPGLKQITISTALEMKRANLVTMLDGLQTRGLIKRHPAPNDGRSHAVYLTSVGQALVRRLVILVGQHEDRITAALGAEARAAFLDMLTKLTRDFRPSLV